MFKLLCCFNMDDVYSSEVLEGVIHGSVFCVFAALMWLDQEITPLNGPTLYPLPFTPFNTLGAAE